MLHAAHLNDDHLFECYVSARSGATMDPRTADHLSDCDACAARYRETVALMEELRAQADVETDEQFPSERLLVQQQQVLRRLEQVNRAARVIAFPGKEAGSGNRAAQLSVRWLAAAAAAGLFIGVAVGGYLGPNRLPGSPRLEEARTTPAPAARPAPAVLVSSPPTPVEMPDDDAFLLELELALAGPRSRELQPFDALTPYVQDIDNRTR